MKETKESITDRIAALIDVKTIVTLIMTVTLVLVMSGKFNPSAEVMDLFKMVYVSVITYFFAKQSNNNSNTPTL